MSEQLFINHIVKQLTCILFTINVFITVVLKSNLEQCRQKMFLSTIYDL